MHRENDDGICSSFILRPGNNEKISKCAIRAMRTPVNDALTITGHFFLYASNSTVTCTLYQVPSTVRTYVENVP